MDRLFREIARRRYVKINFYYPRRNAIISRISRKPSSAASRVRKSYVFARSESKNSYVSPRAHYYLKVILCSAGHTVLTICIYASYLYPLRYYAALSPPYFSSPFVSQACIIKSGITRREKRELKGEKKQRIIKSHVIMGDVRCGGLA